MKNFLKDSVSIFSPGSSCSIYTGHTAAPHTKVFQIKDDNDATTAVCKLVDVRQDRKREELMIKKHLTVCCTAILFSSFGMLAQSNPLTTLTLTQNCESCDLSDRNLARVDFSGTTLTDVNFEGSNLVDTNFSSATLDSVNMTSANFQRANFENVKINNGGTLGFDQIVSEADFRGAKMKNSILIVHFKSSKLSGVDFSGSDIYLKIEDSNLQGVNFSRTRYINKLDYNNKLPWVPRMDNSPGGIFIQDSNLSRANFKDADMYMSHIVRTNLQEANFEGAKLASSNFTDSDLSNANMKRAYLGGVNLSNANLSGADLTGASLKNADLSGTIMCETIGPDGTVLFIGC